MRSAPKPLAIMFGRAIAFLLGLAMGSPLSPLDGQATPLFLAPYTFYDTGNQPYSVAVGDLNGDGRPDVAAACWGSNTAAVLFGAAGGTLGPKTEYAVGPLPRSIAMADLNGDGALDLAIANSNSNSSPGSVSILINNGNGTFQSAVTYPSTGQTTLCVAIGDFNGDGHPDLVTTNYLGNSVSVFMNNGNGTFAPSTSKTVSPNPETVAIGDLNGDGKQDLVVGGTQSSVLLGNGNGTFGPAVFQSLGSVVVLGDVNADGKLDDISALGNGDGTFGPAMPVAAIGGPGITLGDINEDGKLDIATCGNGAGSVVLGNGDGTFSPYLEFPAGTWSQSIKIADMNGGHPDLVVANQLANAVSVYIGNGDGTFFGTIRYFPTGTGTASNVGTAGNVLVDDLNGDGIMDVVIAAATYSSTSGASVSVSLGTGRLEYRPPELYGVGGANGVGIGDLNGDGAPDLVVSNPSYFHDPSATVGVLLGNGDGTFGAKTNFTVGPDPYGLAIADFDRDGNLDVAIVRSDTVTVLHGLGNGSFTPMVDIALYFAAGAAVIRAADINDDGKIDIVGVGNFGSGAGIWVLPGNGNGTFGPEIDTQAPAATLAIGDLNGDGKPDVAAGLAGSDGPVSVLMGNGNGTFGTPTVLTFDGGQGVAIGDVDGDGHLDVASGGNGGTRVILGNGNGVFGGKLGFGPIGFGALADLDGDGRPEIIGTRGASFFVLKNVAALTSSPQPSPAGLVALAQSIPNPARDGVAISFTIPQRGHVSIRLYDVSGRMVRTLYDGRSEAGSHTVRWDRRSASGLRVAPGLYFYDLSVAGERLTRRLVVLE